MINRFLTHLFFLGCMGSFCLLSGPSLSAETTDQDLKVGEYHSKSLLGSFEQPVIHSSKMIDVRHDPLVNLVTRSKKNRKSELIFQARLDECRIGLVDRLLLAEGSADFVTFASIANDFSCKVLRKGGIEIRPANGSFFTQTIPPDGVPGPTLGGLFDHVKFLAYSLAEDAPTDGRELCFTWVGSGKQLNVSAAIPLFGDAVADPHSDPRLACFAFPTLDPDNLATFDWICTNKTIYVLVERLPALPGDYASYTYLIPVLHRDSKKSPLKDIHRFDTCYNFKKGRVTWKIDGKPVFQITQIGVRLNENNAFIFEHGKKKPLSDPTRFQILDHGGVDTPIHPTRLESGIALFTLLDAYPPVSKLKASKEDILQGVYGTYEGLVRLEASPTRLGTGGFFYNNPLLGGAATFAQGGILDPVTGLYTGIPSTYRLFGQGAVLRLFKYEISIKE